MARSWLEVTTDEVQAKLGVNERLAVRRAQMAEQAQIVVDETAGPLFKAAAQTRGWEYREQHDTEWSVVRCGIHGPGELDRDPSVAFFIAEFDAYQPLVVLRHKGEGAAAQPSSRTVALKDLDKSTLEAFLADG